MHTTYNTGTALHEIYININTIAELVIGRYSENEMKIFLEIVHNRQVKHNKQSNEQLVHRDGEASY